MKAVNIRELTHHFSSYLKAVKRGEHLVVMERSSPVADLVPHNKNVRKPDWKRPIKKIRIKGEPLSETVVRLRAEHRW
jgi:antitoxin (DNA-binding transcriptional repressor) of toxin-antitoxin stability system